MSLKSAFSRVLLFGALVLSGPILAVEDFSNIFDRNKLSPAAQDRAFEGKAYLLLDQLADTAAKYVQLTRFGNTIVITGEVENSTQAKAIDALVLDAAGIKRETPAGTVVVPEKDRACGGKPAMGNVKRRMIVKGNKDCSSLRGAEPGQARGRVYNHLGVAAPQPAMKVAESNLLLAGTVLELVDSGHEEVLDRAVMRLVAQDGELYILGKLGETERTRIKAVLMALPGVRGVRFYTD